MARKPNSDPYQCPFTVVIDSNEGSPFGFQGLTADANNGNRPMEIHTVFRSLGRYPNGLGDYSIQGMTDRVAVERKSMTDLWGTVMGWQSPNCSETNSVGRRERFKQELENLSQIEASMVVVEATLGTCLSFIPEWGDRPVDHNRKIFNRSILSMMIDYRVGWLFCDSRRLAEVEVFRFLERFWRKNQELTRESTPIESGTTGSKPVIP